VPQRAEFAGGRAQVERPRAARRLWIVGVALLGFLLASAPMPARAAGALSGGAVTPGSGTTATSFDLSVHYTSSQSERAQEVWADVGGTRVDLTRVSGSPRDGTWQKSTLLPVGTFKVTFNATGVDGSQAAPFTVPGNVVVTVPPTPTPAPTPPPTPRPTPRATAAPTPTPPPGATPRPPSPPPPGITPRPSTPGAQSTPPPDDDDDPTAAPRASASPSGTGEVLSGTPPPKATPEENDAPAESPDATDLADATADEDPPGPRIPLLAPLLVVGGAMSVVGAGVLGRQWIATRRGRPR
jgi:hypothetical protein